MTTIQIDKSKRYNSICIPSAAEDISASQMNTNYKMYFSKYVLINLPAQNLNPGSNTSCCLL
jgi:hypothetical protein